MSTRTDCDEALENLYLYLDAELDAVSSEKIRAHLEECSGCGPMFDFEGRLKSVVRERLDEDVPDVVVDKVRNALREEAARDQS
jgi:mycothiol system anti-sigma-R factor